jgi:hypothetical protein
MFDNVVNTTLLVVPQAPSRRQTDHQSITVGLLLEDMHVNKERLVRQERDMSEGSAKRAGSWQRLCGGGRARATLRKEKVDLHGCFSEDCCNKGKVAGKHLLYIACCKARTVAESKIQTPVHVCYAVQRTILLPSQLPSCGYR